MAGSIKWMLYTGDNGTKYAVKVDKSNGEALGFEDYAGGSETVLPQGTRMRGINCVNEDGNRRFFKVGKNSDPNYNGTNKKVTIDDTEWHITSIRGEKAVRPIDLDTGDDDSEEGGGGGL